MSIRHYHGQVFVAGNANPLPGVQVTIKLAGTNTLGTLFTDESGTTPLANPFTNNPTFGTYDFFIEEQEVDIFLLKTGYAFPPLNNILVGAPLLTTVSEVVPVLTGVPLLQTSALIPAGATLVDVFAHNDVALGTTQGLVSYAVGDGITVDRWGSGLPLTLNFQSTPANFTTPDIGGIFLAANRVYLSAEGGLFDGTGQITVEVKYRKEQAT
jgi:hypothetical protein